MRSLYLWPARPLIRLLTVLLGAAALALALPFVLPAFAGGSVTNCANDADLTAKLSSGGSVTFDCGGSHQAATIVVSSTKTIALATSIDGGGVITLSGGGLTRTFNVLAGGSLSLLNLVLAHGNGGSNDGGAILNDGSLSVDTVTFYSNTVDAAANSGGAIYSDGVLTITHSTFLSNTAYGGGAVLAQSGGRAFISGTLFAGNQALNDRGGAIQNSFSPLTIISSTFQANRAALGAGALAHYGNGAGALVISGSTFFSNTAANDSGGAIYAAGPLNLSSSSIYSNTAAKNGGGGVYIDAAGSGTLDDVKLYGNQALGGFNAGGGGLYNKGTITLTNDRIFDNLALGPGALGGGIFNGTGINKPASMLVASSQITGNQAYNDAGIHNQGSITLTNADVAGNAAFFAGGGLGGYMTGTLSYVRIFDNMANCAGGGMKWTGAAALSHVDIYSNTVSGISACGAGGYGGGLDLEGSMPIVIDASRIFANNVITGQSFGTGAGIAAANYSGPVTLTHSAVYSNVAQTGPGGGIYFYAQDRLSLIASSIYGNRAPADRGGGIFVAGEPASAALILVNSTVANNSAQNAGGIFNADGNPTMTLTNTTLAGNDASIGAGNIRGPAALVNTLLAGGIPNNCGTPVVSRGHNLEFGNSCGLSASGDLTNTSPLLGPLQANGGPAIGVGGGPAWTEVPGPASPAIDHGADSACPATDERGFPRPFGPHCDIGAVEVGVPLFLYLPLLRR